MSIGKIDAIVRQHDEGVIRGKRARVDHVNRRMSFADEARTGRRQCDYSREPAYVCSPSWR
jgi:hypothetical protein